ncbi:hypothetical protein GQ54DRAFT_177066 [Martensiomyces pterosporus]|nr:hypothetical protein GQ54DRAFT_177066 [Martensiomyces pterosporus]
MHRAGYGMRCLQRQACRLSRRLTLCHLFAIFAMLVLLVAGYSALTSPYSIFGCGIGSYYQPRNATLGFQKIFVLNTPTRSDRQRNMRALARFHRLKMDYAKTFSQAESDYLASSQGYLINGTHLACYLSHLNVYRRMVSEGVETALVLEDDVDVEVDLKERHASIMAQVHRQYGHDWDMLYLGHCTPDDNEPGMLHPSIDAGDGRYAVSPAERSAYLNRDVSLYLAEYPMCLHAYALTRECAKRLSVILEERLLTVGQDIDLVLAIGVEYGFSTVLGTSPPYIVQVGRQELPSDLTSLKDGDTAQHLFRSTLHHLKLRSTDPHTLPPFMNWGWFTASSDMAR